MGGSADAFASSLAARGTSTTVTACRAAAATTTTTDKSHTKATHTDKCETFKSAAKAAANWQLPTAIPLAIPKPKPLPISIPIPIGLAWPKVVVVVVVGQIVSVQQSTPLNKTMPATVGQIWNEAKS